MLRNICLYNYLVSQDYRLYITRTKLMSLTSGQNSNKIPVALLETVMFSFGKEQRVKQTEWFNEEYKTYYNKEN